MVVVTGMSLPPNLCPDPDGRGEVVARGGHGSHPGHGQHTPHFTHHFAQRLITNLGIRRSVAGKRARQRH